MASYMERISELRCPRGDKQREWGQWGHGGHWDHVCMLQWKASSLSRSPHGLFLMMCVCVRACVCVCVHIHVCVLSGYFCNGCACVCVCLCLYTDERDTNECSLALFLFASQYS